ncbi:MAG: RHS repeat-associated core domain-containing protein, partial [Rhodanobacter sp.]
VLNRPISTSYTDTMQNVSYTYDEANTVTGCSASKPIGRLTRVVESAVTTVFCYDGRGNIIEKLQQTSVNNDITYYSYTSANRLSGESTPDQTAISYAYDSDGRISGVQVTTSGATSAPLTMVSAISYLPFGPISSYTLGNGQTITRTYDANYRLTDLTSPALNLHFARDAMGDIVALGAAPGANPATETYSYDPLYRLTGITDAGTASESYTYNQTGDRLSKTAPGLATGTYLYTTGTHQLASIGNAARINDADGDMTASVIGGNTFGFGYNGRNRMTVVQLNSQTVANYTYNALGERIGKVASLPQIASERYAYNESGQLIGEYGSSNRDYIWLGDLPVAVVDNTINGSVAASTVNYVTADQLGTPRAVSNNTGTVIWRWSYQDNPFGEQQPTSSTGYVLNLRYPGQYYDAESGTNYNVFRTYEPATGRYLQSDPIGLAGGVSTYAYVGGNPISNFDASGLYCSSSGGSTYCSYPGGPSFIVPTPAGFEDFGNNDPFYHAYDVQRPIGSNDPDCVMKGFINNPVPENPNGGTRPATFGGTSNIAYIPVIGTDNQVTSYVANNLSGPGLVVVNMTGNGSTFSPGYVARAVADGIAHTYGEGTNVIQSDFGQDAWGPIPLGAANNYINQQVWGGQMDGLISNASKKCSCGN